MFFKRNKKDTTAHPSFWMTKELGSMAGNVTLHFWGSDRVTGYYRVVRHRDNFLGFASAENYDKVDLLYKKTKETRSNLGTVATKVLLNGTEEMFLPMIDFVGRPTRYDFEIFHRKLIDAIPSLSGHKLVIFDSTNSYHGYIFSPLTPTEYEEFVHFLKGAPFVDTAWLKSRPHCLRWTKERGKKEPRFAFFVGE